MQNTKLQLTLIMYGLNKNLENGNFFKHLHSNKKDSLNGIIKHYILSILTLNYLMSMKWTNMNSKNGCKNLKF